MNNYNQNYHENTYFHYDSKIKIANSILKKNPTIPRIVHDTRIQMGYINHDIWIHYGDFQYGECISEDKNILVTSLFDELINIMNRNLISDEEFDDNFSEYLKTSIDAIQTIMTLMFEKTWNFDPMSRFMWIYIYLSCRYEPRAIKYLVKSPYFNQDLLLQKDKKGFSPMYHALSNENFDIKFLDIYLTKENLNNMIEYALSNPKTLEYILNKESLIGQLNCNMLLIQSISFNHDSVPIILKSQMMNQNIMNQKDEDNVNVLIYSIIYLPSIFTDLLESIFCTYELFNEYVQDYGTIINVAIKYDTTLIPVILNSKFMNRNLLTICDDTTNIFLNICDSKDRLNEIINNSYYDSNIFLEWLPNLNIATEYAYYDLELFKLLLDNSKINPVLLVECSSNSDVNCLVLGAMNIKILKIIYESKYWINNFLNYTYKSKNIVMLLLENNESEETRNFIREIYQKKLITSDLMNDSDMNGMNTFCYICLYFPEIAIDIINNDSQLQSYVKYTYKLLLFNLYSKKNDELIELIITKTPITQSIVNEINNIYGNNFFMESMIYDNGLCLFLLDHNLVNQDTISQVNVDGDNSLTLLFKHAKKKKFREYNILKKIFDSGFVNALVINHRNMRKEFPFLLSCMSNYNCVKLILESEYFDITTISNKTIENKNSFTFACRGGDINILKLLCNNDEFTSDMFSGYDSSGIPYIYNIFMTSIEPMKYIFNHKYCNTQLLNNSYKLLLLKHNVSSIQLEAIIDSSHCTTETLLCENIDGNNSLALIAQKKNIKLMEKVINSDKFTQEIFYHQNNNKTLFIDYVKDIKMMNIIVNSSKFDSQILSLQDNDGSTLLTRLMMAGEYDIIKAIIESGKCSEEHLKNKNNQEESLLLYIFNLRSDILESILMNVKLDPEDLLFKDKYGNTCLHKYAYSVFDKINGNYFKPEDMLDIINNATKILNLDICSSELFLSKNNDGDTFLLINPYLLGTTLNSKYCTKELLKSVNNNKINIFIEICLAYNHLFSILVNHSLFDSSFLLDTDISIIPKTKINMLSYLCIKSMGDMLKILLESQHVTDKIINSTDDAGYTPLSYAIISQSVIIIKILLSSQFNFNKSFEILYHNNKNLLMISTETSTEIVNILLESKYINDNMFYTPDIYSHNAIIYAVNHGIEMTKSLIESKYWSDNLFFHADIDTDHLIIHAGKHPDVVEYLLNKILLHYSLVKMINGIGKTCAHHYAKINDKSLEVLLKSDKCNDELIQHQDNLGDTCLHIACKYNPNSMKILLSSSFATKELILKQNKNGMNILMLLLQENKPVNKIFKKFGSKELVLQKDIHGNNLLHYSSRYNIKLLKQILNMDYCDEEVLNERNNDNMTCYMYACQYNGKAMEYLLMHKDTTNDMLYQFHTDYGSCLTIAAKYQPIAIKLLLSWEKLAWKILYSLDNNDNFFSVACKYNSDAVKYAIESSYDLTDFINSGIPFYYACKYQPDAVKYILNSNYGSRELILRTVDERVCLDEAYEVQPKALVNILTSKHGSEDLLFHEDEKGYKISYKIAKVFEDVTTLQEIINIKLTSYDNILAEDGDESCNICYTYKPIVIFSPCLHMSCVGCAFKLKKCHKCRTIIENRQVKYD
ncbi:RING finger domain protein [Indivirus ILV1]|uniref:RING finger domain protein n=1 Tax=Indivirus ILV1 TaxID=1977633 RepID=A0A1V0SDJ0_9VIRU|nr:RING finger domain protein [Indivirus ILV1]